MNQKNINIGLEVQKILMERGIENPLSNFFSLDAVSSSHQTEQLQKLEESFSHICTLLGYDLTHPSVEKTPYRLAKMFGMEFAQGLDYNNFPALQKTPNMGYSQPIECLHNPVHSLCEHHWMPIHGVAHVAYIPNEFVIGLSKINRIVHFFSKRPQLQERLNLQIFYALQHILQPKALFVQITADHFCIKNRGVESSQSATTTTHSSFAYPFTFRQTNV
jgi:GTP cyclohydrolase IA